MLSEVSSVPTRDAKGSVEHGLGIFIVEVLEVEGTPNVNVEALMPNLPELGLFYSTVKVSGYPEYQLLDYKNSLLYFE
jgi:hypothetical protein